MKTARKGATLPMVIITILLLSSAIAVLALIIQTDSVQTNRMYSYMNAKYVATSGSQLTLGAYFEGENGKSPLYTEFKRRAESRGIGSKEPITSTHQFKFGTAEIEMTGDFVDNSKAAEDYYITIKSKAKLSDSRDYYVHTVVFNFETSGIRSEKGGIEAGK